MSRIRAVFLGTPDIARHCLAALIKDEHFEIVGVVSQPDRPAGRKLQLQPSPVKELVLPLGIPVLTPENVNDPAVLAQIAAWKAEVAIVVAFGQILKNAFLNMFPQKVVNVHASLLPRWRGAGPIQRALMNGDPESGVSLQVVVRKMDAGPVLGTRKFKQPPEMNAFQAYERCQELATELLEVDLMDYLRGNLTPVPQDESQVTYAAKIDKAESEFDWSRSAMELQNLVRGLAMGPVAQTRRDGKILKIHRTVVVPGKSATARPGQVLEATDKSLIVQCGQDSLQLLEVQPESRSKMPITEYLRGYPVKPGDQFGVPT
ncbi:MAG TPA: methionyl-tRNA formyltransferase [Bdellovibrionales bacterium]|nr:methionyl-tRNA formyltransferase [Bdellovibrionales bacterium]